MVGVVPYTDWLVLLSTTGIAVVAGWQMHRMRRALIAERAASRLRDALYAREVAARRAETAEATGRARAAREVLAAATAVIDAELAWLARNGSTEYDEGGGDA